MEHNLKTFPIFPKFDEQEHHFIHEVAMWKMKREEELQNLSPDVKILALHDSGFTPKMAYINGFNDCKKLMLGLEK